MLDKPNTLTYLSEKEYELVSRVAKADLGLRGGGALGRHVIEEFLETEPEEWRRVTALLSPLEYHEVYPTSTTGKRNHRLQPRLHQETADKFKKLVKAMPPAVSETGLLRLLLLEELESRGYCAIDDGAAVLNSED